MEENEEKGKQQESTTPAVQPLRSRRGWKVILWILASPILLFIVLACLLYIPPIQKFAVNAIGSKLSDSTGMTIHVDDIHLKFPLTLTIGRLTATQDTDTLVYAESADLDVSLIPLFSQRVEINRLSIQSADLNTGSLIEAAHIKGHIGQFDISAHDINLKTELVRLTHTNLSDSHLTITLADSIPTDSSEATNWRVALEKISISNTSIALNLAPSADSTSLNLHIGKTAMQGELLLHDGDFLFHDIDLHSLGISYDVGNAPRAEGFDPSHIAISNLCGHIDSATYRGTGDLAVALNSLSGKEASGIQIDTLKGDFTMDAKSLHAHRLRMLTSDSDLLLDADMDLDAFTPGSTGSFNARLMGAIGKDDIIALVPALPEDIRRNYPAVPMRIYANVRGNAESVRIDRLSANIDKQFSFLCHGSLHHYTEPESEAFCVDMPRIEATIHDQRFVSAFMPADLTTMVRVPAPTLLLTDFHMLGSLISAKGTLTDNHGNAAYDVAYNINTEQYNADITTNNLLVNNYVALEEPCLLSTHITANGQGIDFFSDATTANLTLRLDSASYGSINASNTNLTAKVERGELMAFADCDNPQILTKLRFLSDIRKDNINAIGAINLQRSDFQAMGLSHEPLSIMAVSDFNFSTDLLAAHSFKGQADSLCIVMNSDTIRSGKINIDGWTDSDTTDAVISTQGIDMHFWSAVNALELGEHYMKAMSVIEQQFNDRHIDLNYAKQFLPESDISVSLNNKNAVAQFLKIQGVKYNGIEGHFSTSPVTGLQGRGRIGNLSIKKDSVVIDSIYLDIMQDSTRLTYNFGASTTKKFHHPGFTATLRGYIEDFSADTHLTVLDEKGKPGVDIGTHALATDTAGYFRFYPAEPVIGFRKFKLNTDNYLVFSKKNKAFANIHLADDNATRIDITASPDAQTEQDINLNIENFNIGQLLSVLPMLPKMDGMLDLNANYIQTEGDFQVQGDVTARKFQFGGVTMGDIGAKVSLLPDSASHSLSGSIVHNQVHIADITGMHAHDGQFDIHATLNRLPLSLSEPFLPDRQMVSLHGFLDGHVAVTGSTDGFLVNGQLIPRSMETHSQMHGVKLRFEDKAIDIIDSRLTLDKFNIYGYDDKPLVLNGFVDFADFEKLSFSLSAYGRDIAIVDAPRSSKSVLFGKVNADLFARIVGEPDNISVRGLINVLGSTDMTYLIKDTPLTVEDRLSDLVTFVNFSAPPPEDLEPYKKTITGFDMRLNLNIREGAKVRSEFSSDRQSYINLDGEGQILMLCTPEGVFQLQGRYTLNNGEMKYELPIIPLKTFTIQNGSYVEFTGEPMNPTLNIAATERTRAAVSDANGGSRNVAFDVGLKITNTLNDMGLAFTIEAPEDMSVQNELASMSEEEKNKLAVALLATGMYLSSSNSKGFSSSNALNNFLQSEINNIAGNALSSLVDINLGIEQSQNTMGQTHTDYSFKFSKRFFSDRLSVVIGGKVSADNNADDQRSGTYIDDVSLEWRLSEGSSKYIRLYHDRNYDNLIEGELLENGAGFVVRKKVDHLSELFLFKRKKEENNGLYRNTKQE